ncbi:VF530 family DNA-binding protein [Parathalassolituus penaei]|uniref:VF530 family DNA-binding protein n=1 Tax=Parathalassolituus penaei TaxID=2997323 RepID=A0A9X3EDH5_9GAMM|nr:VF530 family DNA-binding protein [Parathalassolituus penaei]MCY0964804.1 VF530 family DNA-binding protein [Parathalassolituus penaei]
MTDVSDINYKNNPLHGVGLKQMLEELVSHYGFQILFAYLNINCFKTNPTIDASVKFLKKTDWAREKVEVFYLYRFKNLPNPSSEQFKLPPRDRIVPAHHQPREPQVLTLEEAAEEQEKRERKAASHNKRPGQGRGFGDRQGSRNSRDGNGYGRSSNRDNNSSRDGNGYGRSSTSNRDDSRYARSDRNESEGDNGRAANGWPSKAPRKESSRDSSSRGGDRKPWESHAEREVKNPQYTADGKIDPWAAARKKSDSQDS